MGTLTWLKNLFKRDSKEAGNAPLLCRPVWRVIFGSGQASIDLARQCGLVGKNFKIRRESGEDWNGKKIVVFDYNTGSYTAPAGDGASYADGLSFSQLVRSGIQPYDYTISCEEPDQQAKQRIFVIAIPWWLPLPLLLAILLTGWLISRSVTRMTLQAQTMMVDVEPGVRKSLCVDDGLRYPHYGYPDINQASVPKGLTVTMVHNAPSCRNRGDQFVIVADPAHPAERVTVDVAARVFFFAKSAKLDIRIGTPIILDLVDQSICLLPGQSKTLNLENGHVETAGKPLEIDTFLPDMALGASRPKPWPPRPLAVMLVAPNNQNFGSFYLKYTLKAGNVVSKQTTIHVGVKTNCGGVAAADDGPLNVPSPGYVLPDVTANDQFDRSLPYGVKIIGKDPGLLITQRTNREIVVDGFAPGVPQQSFEYELEQNGATSRGKVTLRRGYAVKAAGDGPWDVPSAGYVLPDVTANDQFDRSLPYRVKIIGKDPGLLITQQTNTEIVVDGFAPGTLSQSFEYELEQGGATSRARVTLRNTAQMAPPSPAKDFRSTAASNTLQVDLPLEGGIILPLTGTAFERSEADPDLPSFSIIGKAPQHGAATRNGQFVYLQATAKNGDSDQIQVRFENGVERTILIQYKSLCLQHGDEKFVFLPAGVYYAPLPASAEIKRLFGLGLDGHEADSSRFSLRLREPICIQEQSQDFRSIETLIRSWLPGDAIRISGEMRRDPLGAKGLSSSPLRWISFDLAESLARQKSYAGQKNYHVPSVIQWMIGLTAAQELQTADPVFYRSFFEAYVH